MDWRIAHLVEGSELLVAAMGYWPAFHDAYVRRVERRGDVLTIVVHFFEMTREVDARGYFVLTKHHLVTFDLLGVTADTRPDGYEGDILDMLAGARVDGHIEVVFHSAVGSEFSWMARCARMRIVALVPCSPDG